MKRPWGRFIIVSLAMLAMMGALIYKLGVVTLVEGETWAASAEKRSAKTIIVKGERGRILDRNGVVLAYSETCYNVEFLRDADSRTSYDSAVYTESIIKAIDIIESKGAKTIDTSYIVMGEDGELTYDWGVEAESSKKARYKNFCDAMGLRIRDQNYIDYPNDYKKWDLSLWPSAEYAYNYLRRSWYIPEEYSFEQAAKIISIRQEVNLNNYRAYEPITIAYDVGDEVMAEIVERSAELVGVQISESTTRIYPWGETAAHIVGYLSKSANTVTANTLLSMGYTMEQLESLYTNGLYKTNSDGSYALDESGNRLIDMTASEGLNYAYSDYVGVSGIEYTMEAYLSGATKPHQGVRKVETNKNGSIIRELSNTPASDGYDVMLTIDIELQQRAEAALKAQIENTAAAEEALIEADVNGDYAGKDIDTAKTGALVVMDPQTGEILAMASYPSFDPNWFIQGLTEEQSEYLFGDSEETRLSTPLRNKAISARYAPGSIFKMVTGIAGVAEGIVGIDEIVNDRGDGGFYYIYNDDGSITTAGAPKCWKKYHAGHENINLTQALTYSCNFYFCEMAYRLGIETLNEWAGNFGLTSTTGVELTGESAGICGGQSVLFDNSIEDSAGELSISNQKTSLPSLIYKRLCERLREYVSKRMMEIDDQAISACALRLMALQDGSGLDGRGPEIRRIISDELGIPEGYTSAQVWTSEIVTLLNEIQWKPTQTIRTGFGQGVTLVTPIAVARYVSAIANEGTVFEANLVDRIVSSEGNLIEDLFAEVVYEIGDDSELWDRLWVAVKQGLKGVVSVEDEGTAAGKFSPEFSAPGGYLERLAGKTGTAQTGLASIDIEDTSWFVSYTPREGDAELVVIACIPNGYSGSWSTQVIEGVYNFYFSKKDSAATETLVDVYSEIP